MAAFVGTEVVSTFLLAREQREPSWKSVLRAEALRSVPPAGASPRPSLLTAAENWCFWVSDSSCCRVTLW